MLFPLVTLPYLAHTLDKNNFGLVIFCQSSAIFLSLIIEYGFNYTATRDIAEAHADYRIEREIFTNIVGCKIILSLVPLTITAVYFSISKSLTSSFAFSVFLLAVSQGFTPIWYFQGRSQLFFLSLSEIVLRAFILILLVIFVKMPNQGDIYLILFSVASILFSALQNFVIFKKIGINKLEYRKILATLRQGFSLFFFRIGSALYTSGSLVMLGLVVNTNSFAIYSGADRIFRSAAGLTGPVGDAFYPRISATQFSDPEKARKLTIIASVFLIILSLVIVVPLYIYAQECIKILLGEKYIESVPLFRILLLDIPLIALGTVLGVFGLLPRKLDRYFTFAVLAAGLWSVFSIFVLVPRLGLVWMAATILIAELIVIVVCSSGILVYKRKSNAYAL